MQNGKAGRDGGVFGTNGVLPRGDHFGQLISGPQRITSGWIVDGEDVKRELEGKTYASSATKCPYRFSIQVIGGIVGSYTYPARSIHVPDRSQCARGESVRSRKPTNATAKRIARHT